MPAITPLPTPPSTSDPENFATEADAFLGALPTFGDELNEFAENLNNFSTSATSVTSNTVGTGSKAFTVETGKGFLPGQSLTIARTAAPANRMFALVDTYNSGTGALVVTSQAFEGSGTFTDWTITLGFNGQVSTTQLQDGILSADAAGRAKMANGFVNVAKLAYFPSGHLSGLTMSTAGASSTMTIAAGEAVDSTNTALMQLAASISKTTSAWAVGTGNGGLDTGVIANSTSYHFYLIRRPDTGVVDVIFSTNASAPTLPANYTQYRRIGSCDTNGSAQWRKFYQDGDVFTFDAPTLSHNTTNQGTSAVTATLDVPLGIRVEAKLNVALSDINNANGVLISDLSVTDSAASASAAPLVSVAVPVVTAGQAIAAPVRVFTSTSKTVRTRLIASGVNTLLRIAVTGYVDTRNKNV
jgi:hypothetical protein